MSRQSKAAGMLIVFTNFPQADDLVIDEWYTREHLASRVNIDGFLKGRRYESERGNPRYLAVYDTVDSSVLASQAYLDVGARPDLSEKTYVSRFLNTHRTVCDVSISLGQGVGSVIEIIALTPHDGERESARTWLSQSAIPALLQQRGIVAGHLWETNPKMLDLGSRGFVPKNDVIPDWLLAVEATRPAELDVVVDVLGESDLFHRMSAGLEQRYGRYQLLMTMDH